MNDPLVHKRTIEKLDRTRGFQTYANLHNVASFARAVRLHVLPVITRLQTLSNFDERLRSGKNTRAHARLARHATKRCALVMSSATVSRERVYFARVFVSLPKLDTTQSPRESALNFKMVFGEINS